MAAPGDCSPGTTPYVVYQYGFESGASGWTTPAGVGTNTWALSTANPLPTGENPVVLKFWHLPNLENSGATACYDGGILEVSTNGGATWTQVPAANLLAGGYTGAVSGSFSNPLGGLQAWCGPTTQPYIQTIADVSAYAGQTVQFRMRIGTDTSVSRTGWDVDDVMVQSCQTPTAVELSSVDATSSQAPVAPLAGLPLGALAATALALGAGYALRRR